MRQWRNTQARHVDVVYKRLNNHLHPLSDPKQYLHQKIVPNIWHLNTCDLATLYTLSHKAEKARVTLLIHFGDGETQAQRCRSYTATSTKLGMKPSSLDFNPT